MEKESKEKKGGNRLAHLREIETKLQKEWKDNKVFEAVAPENWSEKTTFEAKNKEKSSIYAPCETHRALFLCLQSLPQ